jgi:hypothetical protein
MNSTPSTVVALVRTGRTRARAECRLAAAASKRARHISTLALLEQHDQEQEKTHEHV